jgi:hypothetical protein
MLRREGFEPQDLAKTRAERLGQALSSATVPGNVASVAASRALPVADYMGGDVMETSGGRSYVQRVSQMPEAVAGRQRSMQTAEEIATANREATLQAERDKRLGAQRMTEIGAQTASAERIAGMRADGQGAGGRTSRGSVTRDILPTVVRNAKELASYTPNDIKSMSAAGIWAATTAPLLSADPTPMSVATAGAMNWASGRLGTGKEQLYAQMIASTADAAARIGEAVGVLTNQDVARYRAQVTPLPGDSDNVKVRKHDNAVSWSNFLSQLGQFAANPDAVTDTQREALRKRAAELGSGTDERVMFDTWARANPKNEGEDNRTYVARFRSEIGLRR